MVSSRTSVTILLFTVLVLCTLPSPTSAARPPKVSPPSPAPVEYVLAIQWGFTVCNKNPICQSIKIPKDFTIHGLWMIGQPDPAVCKGDKFSDILVKHKESDLNKYWVDAEFGNNKNFWRREYDQHGVCDNGTVYSYFDKVLNVYTSKILRNNLGKEIMKLYSTPTVKQGVLYSTLKALISKEFGMVCKYDEATGVYKLWELRIQFIQSSNQVLTMVDLAKMPVEARCPAGADIMLPLH